jgi:hypothetical protein
MCVGSWHRRTYSLDELDHADFIRVPQMTLTIPGFLVVAAVI